MSLARQARREIDISDFVPPRTREETIETLRWLDTRVPLLERNVMSPRTESILARITREANETLIYHQRQDQLPRNGQPTNRMVLVCHVERPEAVLEKHYASDIIYSAAIRRVKQRQLDNFMYHLGRYFPDCEYQEVEERCSPTPEEVTDDLSAVQHLLSTPWFVNGQIVAPEYPYNPKEWDIYEAMLRTLARKFNFMNASGL